MRCRVLLLAIALGGVALADSATPPEGPPWKRDLAAARKEALEAGKPIFLYFTKTY